MDLKDAGIIQINGQPRIKLPWGPKDNPEYYTGRMYEHDGVRGLAVSTAMDCFAEITLQEWLRRTDPEKIAETVSSAADFGTQAHRIQEAIGDGKKVEVPTHMQDWQTRTQEYTAKYTSDIEYSEVKVFSKKHLYGGTIDRIGMFAGKRSIIDWKTGRFHFSDLWKTEAYRRAYIEMTGDEDVGTVVVYAPKKDGIAPKHYTVEHHDGCFMAFLSAHYLFRMTYFRELKEAGYPESRLFDLPRL